MKTFTFTSFLLYILLVLETALLSSYALAEQKSTLTYAVQIAAYTSSAPDYLVKRLQQQGYQTAVEKSGIYNRLLVTGFKSKELAAHAKNALREDGFTDAFIKMVGNADTNAMADGHSHTTDSSNSIHSDNWRHTQAQLKTLTAEQRNQAVLLDGELHIIRGEKFIPLNKLTELD